MGSSSPPPYRVRISPAAHRDLSRLSHDVRKRLLRALEDLGANPRRPEVEALRNQEGRFRYRRGDWRVIFEIHDDVLLVDVVRVRHRNEAYE